MNGPIDDAGLYATLLAMNLSPRRAGKGWQCRCPAHDDRSPSLSACVSGGRLLLYCHAGCTFEQVRSALGVPRQVVGLAPPPRRDVAAYIAPNWREIVRSSRPAEVDRREKMLGLPPGSLRRIGAVWAVGIGALAAPMYGPDDEPIGVRFRADDGRKWAMSGSRNGLFGLGPSMEIQDTLYLPEGMTDTAALAGVGLWAIGRPSCMGGREYVRGLVRHLPRPTLIVVVSDADLPGRRGAATLADELTRDGRRVRVLTPAPGCKDVREWVASGATRETIESAARACVVWQGLRGGCL